jgi:hypothetical protein
LTEGSLGWESLWFRLLSEAALLAQEANKETARQMAASAASIVLAKNSIDCFIGEFGRWRNLPAEFRRFKFHNQLQFLRNTQQFLVLGDVAEKKLLVLHEVRNRIVHHNTKDELPEAMQRAIFYLENNHPDILSPIGNWESRLLNGAFAVWACMLAAEFVLNLERNHHQRIRAVSIVENQVRRAVLPISNLAGKKP